ncbi:MAG: response regulator transcription factor [Desulfovibrio sp.]|nr:response regulator transcription factor [Desulfovibrio sp.]MCA1985360.1 response regulator transcription factor [Desulfovibrio sp.]
MKRVLLVDDDVELSGMLTEYLEREGMAVVARHDGLAGVEACRAESFDIAVLDVMMPGIDGMEVLRRIRAFSRLPVLMLTARGDEVDCVVGLELGADDYVAKPCTPRELAARLRAILRRTAREDQAEGHAVDVLTVGALTMWPQERRAQWQGAPLELTSTEYSLLELLARNAGRPVSKADLSEQALGRPLARYDRSIDVHMSSIRHKLAAGDDTRAWIQTIRGLGYQFVRI